MSGSSQQMSGLPPHMSGSPEQISGLATVGGGRRGRENAGPEACDQEEHAHILFLSDLRCVVGGRPAYGLASVVDEDVKLAEPRGDQRTERLDTSH
eukprot:1422169-Rhodomonas_salina.1